MQNFRILSKNVKFCALLPLLSDVDVVSKEVETVKSADLSKVEETGKDRVLRMFSLDEHESMSLELTSIIQVTSMSMFIGAIYGGVLNSRTAYMDFMANNQATAFKNHIEAKKKLQDKVTLSFGKGAFRWGWRLSLFSTTYMTVSTTIAVYRGKFGIVEHLAAGTIAGAAYKLPLGPRGWIVGAGLGCALGAVAGTCTYAVLSVAGLSMQDIRYWQYNWKDSRTSKFKEAVEERRTLEEAAWHNMKVGDAGKDINNLEKQAS